MHPSEIEILQSIKNIEIKAINNIEKWNSESYKKIWKPLENGWFVAQPRISGITGNFVYEFSKPLKKPIRIESNYRGNKFVQFIYLLKYSTGFSSINTKDIHKYTLKISTEGTQIDGIFYGNKINECGFIKGVSKQIEKLLIKNGEDLTNLPDPNNHELFPLN